MEIVQFEYCKNLFKCHWQNI